MKHKNNKSNCIFFYFLFFFASEGKQKPAHSFKDSHTFTNTLTRTTKKRSIWKQMYVRHVKHETNNIKKRWKNAHTDECYKKIEKKKEINTHTIRSKKKSSNSTLQQRQRQQNAHDYYIILTSTSINETKD